MASGRIFLNYRRKDEPGYVQALYLALEREFGFNDVFMDIQDAILPGERFSQALRAGVAGCKIVLVIIGPRWLELLKLRDGDGDYVLQEITLAFASHKRIIPVLVGGVQMPSKDCLPRSLEGLAALQAIALRPDSFSSDSLRLISHLQEHFRDARPMTAGALCPAWAVRAGEDNHGRWAEFQATSVPVRMRWVPAGSFVMGSGLKEAGHCEREGPQHKVSLCKPFWIGQAPCTQALWSAAMDQNPSEFVSPSRPVERVSWRDCLHFLQTINARNPGLELRLPTEAEWEYACRAGTTTGTYAGDLEITGVHRASQLDDIAWYGGNSGLHFDLEHGADSCDWPEKHHPHAQAGTRPVGQKAQNGWGLHDMLGNVWEWCADGYRRYQAQEATDPHTMDGALGYVIRGGAWDSPAREVRAAARMRCNPECAYDWLGFRVARNA